MGTVLSRLLCSACAVLSRVCVVFKLGINAVVGCQSVSLRMLVVPFSCAEFESFVWAEAIVVSAILDKVRYLENTLKNTSAFTTEAKWFGRKCVLLLAHSN